jgi:tetratricopeptide (TPR) repeat protein
VTVVLLLDGSVAHPVLAADAADESRAISQQVLALIKTSNLSEAQTLARKGLLLCEDVGDVKVFCKAQFNESLGDIEYAQKQYPSSLEYYEQALHIREAGLVSGHFLVNRSLLRIGRTYLALGRATDAETFIERAVAGYEKLVPVNRELGTALSYLRSVYLDTGRVDEAVATTRRELGVYEAIGAKDGPDISGAKSNLSSLLSRQALILLGKNDYSGAEPKLIEAIKLVDPPPAGKENLFAALQAQLGNLYERQRRYAEAEPFMLRALEYRSKTAGPADTEMPTMLTNLASLYNNSRRPADAVPYALRAIAWLDENKQEKSTLGFALLHLGRAQRRLGHLPDAEVALLRARDVLDRVLPETDHSASTCGSKLDRSGSTKNDLARLSNCCSRGSSLSRS